MLARMNFASQLAAQPEVQPRARGKPSRGTPESLLTYFLDALQTAPLDTSVRGRAEQLSARDGRRGPAATRSCRSKSAGLVHLIAGCRSISLSKEPLQASGFELQ